MDQKHPNENTTQNHSKVGISSESTQKIEKANDNYTREEMIDEYKMLRKEISEKITLQNTLVVGTLTVVAAFLTFGVLNNTNDPQKLNNDFLLLLPIFVIFPISLRVLHYRRTIAKISAYMIAVLEPQIGGFNWETKNKEFIDYLNKPSEKDFFGKLELHGYEFPILATFCFVTFFVFWSESFNTAVNIKSVIDDFVSSFFRWFFNIRMDYCNIF